VYFTSAEVDQKLCKVDFDVLLTEGYDVTFTILFAQHRIKALELELWFYWYFVT